MLRVIIMKSEFERALRDRRAEIRARWREILFVEPVTTPLADPRTLVFLLDDTLDRLFAALGRGAGAGPVPWPVCACGRNPFLAYFRAGRQALLEALVMVVATAVDRAADERDEAFAELEAAISRVARDEIEGFRGLCTHRSD